MSESNQSLKLIEKNDSTLFGQFLEKFESENFTEIYITTLKQYEGFVFLFDCLDNQFFCNNDLSYEFNEFIQNNSFKSLTHIKFKNYNKKDDIENLFDLLLKNSKELKKQKETVIVELSTLQNEIFNFKTKFCKNLISNNKKNKKFLFLTNNKSLIKLYEKI